MFSSISGRIRLTSRLLLLGCHLAGIGIAASSARAETARTLGEAPLCEASAALVVKCPSGSGACLLVADNEVKDEIFIFNMEEAGGSVRLSGQDTISLRNLSSPIGGGRLKIEDIEAMTALPSGELMLFGSHGRNKRCEIEDQRLIFTSALLEDGKIKPASTAPQATVGIACPDIVRGAAQPLADKVCKAIETSEDQANAASERRSKSDREDACRDATPAFNLEGAVAVPDASDGAMRVWVGLRAPLVEGKAVLARMVRSRDSFEFDALALIALGDFGIRDLTFDRGKVWGIAGPAADSNEAHKLWSLEASKLRDGADLKPDFIGADLETSAEGIAISAGNAVILIDGDKPDDRGGACRKESKYTVRRISD